MKFVPEFLSKLISHRPPETPVSTGTPENNVKLDAARMASMQASKDALEASAPQQTSSIIPKPELDRVTGFVQPTPDDRTNEELAAQVIEDASAAAPSAEAPQQPATTSAPLDKTG